MSYTTDFLRYCAGEDDTGFYPAITEKEVPAEMAKQEISARIENGDPASLRTLKSAKDFELIEDEETVKAFGKTWCRYQAWKDRALDIKVVWYEPI